MADPVRFEVGKVYVVGLMADHTHRIPFIVVSRTDKTVTVRDRHGAVIRRRVDVHEGEETIQPMGRYSLAPHMRAGRDIIKKENPE